MSLSKFGPRTRSLRQSPWIVNNICSPTRKPKGQTIDVIRHVETMADGSMVREVADGDVIIRAVFSAKAVEKFRKEQEDSDSCPVDWHQALLLVVEYHTEFRPHRNLAQCEFVLHINLFRLWDLQEGFQRKHRLVHCEADARIQKKTKELWEEKQIEWQREGEQNNSKSTSSHLPPLNESTASVSLTQLLEEMAKDDELKETTDGPGEIQGEMVTGGGNQNMMTRQVTEDGTTRLYTQEEMAKQDQTKKSIGKETLDGGEHSNNQDLRRPFIFTELLIPEHEKLILEEIAEWKEGYIPPVTSINASSEEVGSNDNIDSYVRHTLIDDVSSLETVGQPSPPKKGRKDLTPKEGTDDKGGSRIPCVQWASPGVEADPGSKRRVARSSALPKAGHGLMNSTQQNATKVLIENQTENDTRDNVVETVNTCLGLTDAQQENIPSETQRSGESLNDSGPFTMCDIPESQGFIPCVSPENGSTSHTIVGRIVTTFDNAISLTRRNKSLEALEKEEEKRLKKLATPSKGFTGGNVRIPAVTVQQSTATKQQDRRSTDSDRDQTDDEIVTNKTKARVKKIPREETPYSSSQTDSEPDNQVKRRRLTFPVAKLGRGNSLSPSGSKRNRDSISKDISCHQGSVKRTQTEDVRNASEPWATEHAVSGIRGSRSKGTRKDHHVAGETLPVQDLVTGTIIISSSQESFSSGDSPSVLRTTKRKRRSDHDDWPSHSLPSYQPRRLSQSESPSFQPQSSQSQNLFLPSSDTPHSDKAMLLASLTDLAAPTEIGQKLLALTFSDKLVKQIVDFYTLK